MNAGRVAIVSLAVAGGAALVAVGSGRSAAATESQRGAVADCSRHSEGRFPHPFTNPDNLRVGPFVLVGAGGTAGYSAQVEGNKFPAIVKPGHRVTVAVPRSMAGAAGLTYAPRRGSHPADAHRVVTFIACRRSELSAAPRGRPRAFWSGKILAESPRCIPLRVWVDDERSPRRIVLRLGVDSCQ